MPCCDCCGKMPCAGGEVSKANVGDFDPDAGKLLIYGKGRGSQGETITLSFHIVAALEE